jgi:hypothetical protein
MGEQHFARPIQMVHGDRPLQILAQQAIDVVDDFHFCRAAVQFGCSSVESITETVSGEAETPTQGFESEGGGIRNRWHGIQRVALLGSRLRGNDNGFVSSYLG